MLTWNAKLTYLLWAFVGGFLKAFDFVVVVAGLLPK